MQKGFTVWFTGLKGAGKTTLSNMLHHALKKQGVTNVELLDGEDARAYLSKGLAFTSEDIDTHITRLGWVAHLLTRNNIPNIVSSSSPNRTSRDEVRRMVEHAGGAGAFVEVFVDKQGIGLGTDAKAGAYEAPHRPELRLDMDKVSAPEGVEEILGHLKSKGLI